MTSRGTAHRPRLRRRVVAGLAASTVLAVGAVGFALDARTASAGGAQAAVVAVGAPRAGGVAAPAPAAAAAQVPAGSSPSAPAPRSASASRSEPVSSRARGPWVGTWATAVAVPQAGPPAQGFTDTTLRQRIHVSVGGQVVRLRLTNVHGTRPLVVTATLARPSTRAGAAAGDVDPATLVPVPFAGSRQVAVPVGAELASDPVALAVPDDGDLLVSLHVPGPTGPATYHGAAHTTGFVADGDQTSAVSVAAFPRRTTSFWFLDGLDVRSRVGGSVVFLGDSITDGSGSTTDADHRWPDLLADRARSLPTPQRFGVLNAGIGGNRVLRDAAGPGQGPKALDRLTRDVLTQTGVRTVVLLEGINDIQQDPSEHDPRAIIDGYRQVLERSHARGLRVVVGTLAPFEGWPRWTPEREQVRVAVNAWIRTSGEPDAVLDLDAVLRDPDRPTRLRAGYDSGDHLHPSDAGYAAMAASVDLRLLRNPGR